MGWNARIVSGDVISECEVVKFRDIPLHDIEEMWLDGLENLKMKKDECVGFVEFVQFGTAGARPDGVVKLGEYIGWTNGEYEFVIGISLERHSFHPETKCKSQS